jgi:hypothetical protein
MRHLGIILTLFGLSLGLWAQQPDVNLRVHVVDETGTPLEWTTVRVDQGDKFLAGAYADEDGRCAFRIEAEGKVQVMATFAGFIVKDKVVSERGKCIDLEMQITLVPVLEPVVIMATSPYNKDGSWIW